MVKFLLFCILFDTVLAARAGGPGPVPDRVARAAAVPAGGDCRRRGARAGDGHHLSSGARAARHLTRL